MFCKNCGKELNESAVVCTGCGCAVEQTQGKKQKGTSNIGSCNISIIGFVLALVSIFSLMFYPLMLETVYISFAMSIALIIGSIIISIVGRMTNRDKASKWYGLTAISIAVCSFACVLTNFILFIGTPWYLL